MSDDGKKGDDDARKIILARRARFVAAAMAGLGVACGKTTSPEPCLSQAVWTGDASADPTAAPQGADAAGAREDAAAPSLPTPDSGATTSATPAPDASTPPQPCLRVAAPHPSPSEPPPRPCLSVVAPPSSTNAPPPRPCLKVVAPPSSTNAPPPRPCLKVAPPKGGGDFD